MSKKEDNPFSKYWIELPKIYEAREDIRQIMLKAIPDKPYYLPQIILKDLLELSKSTVIYHLDILEKAGKIIRQRIGKYAYLQKIEET